MKILLSPSKTQAEPSAVTSQKGPALLDQEATLSLFHRLGRMSLSRMGQAMDLQGKLLEKTNHRYRSFDPLHSPTIKAIRLYTGLVYDQLKLDEYDEAQWAYLNDHVRILSAMYGLLHPQSQIWPYRLDYSMRLPALRLKALWKDKIAGALAEEDWIIDLSSQEFGSLLAKSSSKIHQVHFFEIINGKERIISANAKKVRGKMANFLIQNQVIDLDHLRRFEEDGYVHQPARSSVHQSVFIKQCPQVVNLSYSSPK